MELSHAQCRREEILWKREEGEGKKGGRGRHNRHNTLCIGSETGGEGQWGPVPAQNFSSGAVPCPHKSNYVRERAPIHYAALQRRSWSMRTLAPPTLCAHLLTDAPSTLTWCRHLCPEVEETTSSMVYYTPWYYETHSLNRNRRGKNRDCFPLAELHKQPANKTHAYTPTHTRVSSKHAVDTHTQCTKQAFSSTQWL